MRNMTHLLLAIVLISTLLVSGCIMPTDTPADEAPEEDASEPGPIEMNEAPDVNCTEQYEVYQDCIKTLPIETCENLIDMDCVQVVDQEKIEGNFEAVANYLDAHPIEIFGEQSNRLLAVDYEEDENKTTLTYKVSTIDPAMESYYLAGVLLIVFPDIEDTRVEGLNAEDKVIEISIKFPSRDGYVFSDLYFPDYVQEAECVDDTDCDDNDVCTIDKCSNSMCSNAYTIKDGCSGP